MKDQNVRIVNVPYYRLRGFQKGKVGPIDNTDYIGGNYATAFNVATTLPGLFKDLESMDFSIFFDAGNVWGVDYSDTIDDTNKIRSSTGVNVSWLSPIGPMTMVFSQNISKASTDQDQAFSFKLGTTF